MTYDEQRRKYVVRWRENGRRRIRRFDTPEQARGVRAQPAEPTAAEPATNPEVAALERRLARARGQAGRRRRAPGRARRRRLPLRDQAGHPLRLQVPPERPQLEHPPRLHQPARRARRQARARGVHPTRRGQGRARDLRGLLEPLSRRAQALPGARHLRELRGPGPQAAAALPRTEAPVGDRRGPPARRVVGRDGRARRGRRARAEDGQQHAHVPERRARRGRAPQAAALQPVRVDQAAAGREGRDRLPAPGGDRPLPRGLPGPLPAARGAADRHRRAHQRGARHPLHGPRSRARRSCGSTASAMPRPPGTRRRRASGSAR